MQGKWLIISVVIIVLIWFVSSQLWAQKAQGAPGEYPYKTYMPIAIKGIPPTSMPTPTTPLVVIEHNSYDIGSATHIVGSLKNTATYPVYYVSVAAAFFSDSGAKVHSESSYVFTYRTSGNETSLFHVKSNISVNWARYELSTNYSDARYLDFGSNIVIVSSEGHWNNSKYIVSGIAQNNDSQYWPYVRIITALHDSSGKLLDATYTYVDTTGLVPGQQAPFRVTFEGSQIGDVASYQVDTHSWRLR